MIIVWVFYSLFYRFHTLFLLFRSLLSSEDIKRNGVTYCDHLFCRRLCSSIFSGRDEFYSVHSPWQNSSSICLYFYIICSLILTLLKVRFILRSYFLFSKWMCDEMTPLVQTSRSQCGRIVRALSPLHNFTLFFFFSLYFSINFSFLFIRSFDLFHNSVIVIFTSFYFSFAAFVCLQFFTLGCVNL